MHCVMQIIDDSSHILLSLNEAKEGIKLTVALALPLKEQYYIYLYSAFQKIQRHLKEQLKNKIRTCKTISK